VTVYVDSANIGAAVNNRETGRMVRGRWSHLMADTREELIEFATQKLRLRASYFQTCKNVALCGPPDKCPHFHFDVTAPKRAEAIRHGAQEIDMHQAVELVKRIRAAMREADQDVPR